MTVYKWFIITSRGVCTGDRCDGAVHKLWSVSPAADVKPSNVLINTQGQVKMCDFGISGYLVDSVAKTMDAGCKPYMAVSRKRPMKRLHGVM